VTVRHAAVNEERVELMARLLSRISVPADMEEPSLDCAIPPSVLPDVYFALVAICHQTTPRGEPPLGGIIDGQLFTGWDYLREAFLRAARVDCSLFTPSRLAVLSESDLDSIVQIAAEPVHLSSLSDRARLVRDIGVQMRGLGIHSVTALHERSDGRLVQADGTGLLDALARFRAYRDPVKKNSFYFLALMRNLGLWELRDPENLGAPVDYHEVRGHLRCGTVVINDPSLETRVRVGIK
jgi:hypothetical protein